MFLISNAHSDSGAEFLNIGINPRALALGNAYSAVADDSSAVYWNPAGLNRIFNSEIFLTRQKWLFDTSIEFLSIANRFRFGVCGFSLSYFHMPEFEIFGEHGEREGNASIYDLLFISSYASKYKGILYGINFKYIRRVIDEDHGDAFAGDFGIIYSFDLLKIYKSPAPNFDLSFVVKNIGTKMTFISEAENLPLTFTTGLKYNIMSKRKQKLFFSSDINYRSNEPSVFGMGIEYSLLNIFFVRGGYKHEDEVAQLIFGTGISYDISSFNLNFDMALFRFREETIYPYSLGIKNSMNKSLKVSRIKLKKQIQKTEKLENKNKIVIGFMNFKNLTKKTELDYLSSAIPESVNTIISKNTNLVIIETEKINFEMDVIEIDTENQYNYMKLYENLGVEHLITGSYLETDDKIKVNLKIIDVKNNKIIYGKSIEGASGKNVFSLIDKIVIDLSEFYRGRSFRF